MSSSERKALFWLMISTDTIPGVQKDTAARACDHGFFTAWPARTQRTGGEMGPGYLSKDTPRDHICQLSTPLKEQHPSLELSVRPHAGAREGRLTLGAPHCHLTSLGDC